MRIETLEQRTASGIFYRRHGPSKAANGLILCHGLASNSTRWNELAARIDLPSDWCLLCPDLRGHGMSVRRGRIDSEIWIDDLVGMLDQAGIGRAVVGGHCMGANLALRFGLACPERCQGLILIEPMLAQARIGRMKVKTTLRWMLPGMALVARAVNALGFRRAQIPVLDLQALDTETRQAMMAQGSATAMTRRYAAPLSDLKYIPVAAYLQALCETLKRLPAMAHIEQPTLTLLSSGGLFGDPERTARALAAIPECRLETLDAAHWIPTEQPDQMRQLIESWLLTRFG